MDEIKKAMLGDKEAQRAVTERGELLPCMCGGDAILKKTNDKFTNYPVKILNTFAVHCNKCTITTADFGSEIYQSDNGEICVKKDGAKEAIKAWNTRPQLLTAEEMDRLEGLE